MIEGFIPASRKGTFVLVGLTGHSGTGKTMSAILLARGLVGPNGKIAGIDTENGRMHHFSNLTPYDVAELNAPFTPARYVEKIKMAETAGYQCLIIDSFSHEWEGTGGVLEMADNQRSGEGKALSGLLKWAKPKAEHKKLVNAVLQSRMHIIICMRGKDKLVQKKDEKGKEVIINTGVVPIQDSRFLFEMTVSLIMQEGAMPKVQKCPADLRNAFPENKHITQEAGKALAAWISAGAPVNYDHEAVKQAAKEEAEKGAMAFRAHWQALDVGQRDIIRPNLHELQSIAEAADTLPDEPPIPADNEESLVSSFSHDPRDIM